VQLSSRVIDKNIAETHIKRLDPLYIHQIRYCTLIGVYKYSKFLYKNNKQIRNIIANKMTYKTV